MIGEHGTDFPGSSRELHSFFQFLCEKQNGHASVMEKMIPESVAAPGPGRRGRRDRFRVSRFSITMAASANSSASASERLTSITTRS